VPFSPPTGFIELPSALEGIRVFGPAPDAVEQAPRVARCPQCGATMAFDPARQAAVCTACGSAAEVAQAVGHLAHAEAQDFTLDALRKGARGWGSERRTLHCDSCGADLAVEPASMSTCCPFCGSNKVALQAGDPEAIRPGWVLPFRLRAEELGPRVREFLGRGWMHPGELARLAKVERFTGVYLPLWIFDADTASTYRCEVGTEREVTRWEDGKLETHTVIDWAWTQGEVARRWTDVRISATGRVSAILLARVLPDFDMGGLAAYESTLLAGFSAMAYEVDLPAGWEAGRAEIRNLARGACESHAKRGGGSHIRSMTMSARLHDESWRYALVPVYATAYQFGERNFQVLVNGQTGKVAGQKPVVWWRIYAVIAVMLLPATCTGALGLPLLLAGGVGLVPLVFALVFLIFGLVGGVFLYKAAQAAEAA
jgi:Zn finger protein HypA/HybF involved in hydrogenase expression